ncbi:MAG: hypothetical protein WEA11_00240 [Acidimicrobiales bacterium]
MPELLNPSSSGHSFGKGPTDAIFDAAHETTHSGPYSSCGLGATELAAMMMTPTYFEAGGPVPSPMALSRWDNISVRPENKNLFPFGDTNGPYVGAFFSPGVGLWQFDSAGPWDLTAADAIDTVTAARAAASVIAYRWCSAPQSKLESAARRLYSWGPWFGCGFRAGFPCESRYQQLLTNGSVNASQDFGVDRFGGMQQRTCNIVGIGTGVTCWYVNPANSKGSSGWKSGSYDPTRTDGVTPLPKPFYVVRANGREYRYWVKADTGFAIGITASRPVTKNARTTLVWEQQAALCDTTMNRGECGPIPPIGVLDSATVTQGSTGSLRVTGWAWDRDTTGVVPIHVYIGAVGNAATTGSGRADVAAVYPGAPGNTGFDITLPSAVGSQRVCAFAIDVGGTLGNPQLGCRDVVVTSTPRGIIDSVVVRPGAIDVSGWSVIPGDPSSAAIISVNGVVQSRMARTVSRPDVQAGIAGVELNTGFSGSIEVTGGRHVVCLTTGTLPLGALGCRVVTSPGGSPFGALDVVAPRLGGVSVSGWVVDPDIASAVTTHIYVNGAGYAVTANANRPDIGGGLPAYGPAHGFVADLPAPGGAVTVCAYGINVGLGAHSLLGCRTTMVPTGSPFGVIDTLARSGNSVTGSGWVIDPDTAASIPVHVYVDGVGYALTANGSRPDVAGVFPAYGPAYGYTFSLPFAAGPARVCIYGIEIAGTGGNVLLGCRTV